MIHGIDCKKEGSSKFIISWLFTDLNGETSINHVEVGDYEVRNTIINKLIEAQIGNKVVTKKEIKYIRAKR